MFCVKRFFLIVANSSFTGMPPKKAAAKRKAAVAKPPLVSDPFSASKRAKKADNLAGDNDDVSKKLSYEADVEEAKLDSSKENNEETEKTGKGGVNIRRGLNPLGAWAVEGRAGLHQGRRPGHCVPARAQVRQGEDAGQDGAEAVPLLLANGRHPGLRRSGPHVQGEAVARGV